MTRLLANPYVRLGLRAAVAGAIAAVSVYQASGGTVAWHALAGAAALAFCEVFTPLNALVGVFKKTPA